jgi:hypothetical protein
VRQQRVRRAISRRRSSSSASRFCPPACRQATRDPVCGKREPCNGRLLRTVQRAAVRRDGYSRCVSHDAFRDDVTGAVRENQMFQEPWGSPLRKSPAKCISTTAWRMSTYRYPSPGRSPRSFAIRSGTSSKARDIGWLRRTSGRPWAGSSRRRPGEVSPHRPPGAAPADRLDRRHPAPRRHQRLGAPRGMAISPRGLAPVWEVSRGG